MENKQAKTPALRLLALLAMASALGVAVAVALAGVAMLLAAPAYAGEGSLLLERRGAVSTAGAGGNPERRAHLPHAQRAACTGLAER
jgi:uncharacterized protein involved in exopolysaccharide biosynthesis